MRRALARFPSAFRLLTAFSGGKAAASLRHNLAQKTVKLTAVLRGGAWIEEVGAIHPRLMEGPWLGATLAALARQADQSRGTEPKAPRPEKARFARWDDVLELDSKSVSANASTGLPIRPKVSNRRLPASNNQFAEAPGASAADILSQFPARMDLSLLHRLAGCEFAFERAERKEPRAFPLKVKEKVGEACLPSVQRDSTSHQDWLRRMAQRARRALSREQLDAAQTIKPTHSIVPTHDEAPLLPEQWMMPLDGTCASSELLNSLLHEELPGGKESSEMAQRRFPRAQSAALEKPVTQRPRRGLSREQLVAARTIKPTHSKVPTYHEAPLLPEQWMTPRDETCASSELLNSLLQENLPDGGNDFEVTAKLPDTEAQTGSPLFAPEPGVGRSRGHGEPETKSSPPIVPPNVTSSLPPLLSSRKAGTPPLPIAAATVRQGAREETVTATDDLDALAAKIELILDEQARRHGIDV